MPTGVPEKSLQVENRILVDVQREAPDSDPFLSASWLRSLIAGIARRIFDFYKDLERTEDRLFPDTADETNALRWGNIYIGAKNPATQSSGFAAATGTSGSVIPISTLLTSDGNEYQTTTAVAIADQVLAVSSITRSGSTATVTTAAEHGLGSNVPVTILGADQAEYNVTDAEIVVTGVDTFQFAVTGTPASPATGTITAEATYVSTPVESTGFGADTNLSLDAIINLQSPIAGVDDELSVDYGTVGGGTDEESTDDYKARYLDRIRNPITHFNVAGITAKAKEVAGVTRVFVEEVTPAVGQVTVYFMRDNDETAIPSPTEVTDVKNALLEIKPANTADEDLIVSAPTAVSVDYTFTALSPDTQGVRDAIEANLAQLHDEQTMIGDDLTSDAYRSAIKNTVDLETGAQVQSFTLSTPTGDVAISAGQIATLGTVTFP